jgi:hypothetical protein
VLLMLSRQARRSSVVYKRHRSHFDSDYLRENADNVAGLLSNALKNNDPTLSQAFKQDLHLFIESVVKTKGTSLNQASRKHSVPHKSLSDYVAKGLIPVLYRDRGTIYIANETAEEVSRDYQEGKEMGIQPARLLRERREKYFPEEASTSGAFEKGQTPDIRARCLGSAQSYEVVATLDEAAEKSGVPTEEIVTTQDIVEEWNINRVRIHEWTRRGPYGQPCLTPLPVRLKGGRGGAAKLLFRQGDIKSRVANLPKPGATRNPACQPACVTLQ